MKKTQYSNPLLAFILMGLVLFSLSCERQFEDMELAKFPTTPDVFIDGFSAGLAYAAFGGSNVTAFDVDKEVRYSGTASMKFAVPDAGDPLGGYAGGVYYTEIGRDLSGYDALTFWAKASKAATIDVVGFGNDLGESKLQVTLQNVQVNSNWKKYIIPIPEPTRLTRERGMFYYSEAPEEGLGYTFWIDELKFEKLGTIAHKEPMIFDGEDKVENTVNGVKIPISGTSFAFNMPTGIDQTVLANPAYFSFASSNNSVATIDSTGAISVLSKGSAVITASSGEAEAEGSLTVVSTGDFVPAPEPTLPEEKVISIFSNAYENVPVDFYNGYWEPFQTTLSADFTANGNDVLNYTNFNFVGIQFTNPPIDASAMDTLHMDIYIPNAVQPTDRFSIQVVDMGPDGTLDGNDPSISYELPVPLVSQTWIRVDISLSALSSRSKLAQIILENLETSLSGFYLDNIYLYGSSGAGPTGPAEAATAPPSRNAGDVISIYSDAYTNLEGTDYPDWGQATILSEVLIESNNTLKLSQLDYQGIQLAENQNITGMDYLHLDFWTDNSSALNVYLISPDPATEAAYALTVPTSGWSSVDIPLSAFSPVDLTKVFQLKFDGNGDIYMDNLYFYKDDGGGGATEPEVAAPDPTQNEADVISLFSGAYMDVSVDSWRTDWSAATYEEVDVAGNATKKYSDLDFVGIETTSSTIDASTMTHVHLDAWSADITQFGIKFVDFGPDGAFGGGDDAEHQLDFPAPVQGQWVSYDIPLSDFTNLTTTGHMAQYILTGQPTGATTIWLDNVYFYNDGSGGGATEPEVAAPDPTQNEADVISLFSGAYTDVSVDSWRTDWSAATYEEVDVAGNATKKYSDLDFVGIETTSSTIDASTMTHVHLDVWSADITQFGIKFVDFGPDGAFGGGDDAEHQLDFPAPVQGQWVSYDIPLSDFTNLTTTGHMAQYILTGQPTGATTIWLDNVYFYNDGSGGGATEPEVAAPDPTQNEADVISLFSGAYTDVSVDSWRTDWSAATYEEVDVVGNATKKYSDLDFVGIETTSSTIDASTMTHVHLDVWSADITQFGIKFVDFGPDGAFGGGDDAEHQLDFPAPVQGQWVSYDIPLSDFTNLTTTGHMAQYILTGQPTGATTIWLDNVYFYNDGSGGGATEPEVAAPDPTQNEADVISLFSGAYTDVSVDSWRTDWSAATYEEVDVVGNATKKYSDLDFVGIETTSSTIDASTMTHVHLDVWSADITQFGIKFVDFGPDGAFGGGDDAEHQLDFPAPVQGQWVSYDIPLSDFTNLTTTGHMAQYILTGQPTGATTIWLDNVYFYK